MSLQSKEQEEVPGSFLSLSSAQCSSSSVTVPGAADLSLQVKQEQGSFPTCLSLQHPRQEYPRELVHLNQFSEAPNSEKSRYEQGEMDTTYRIMPEQFLEFKKEAPASENDKISLLLSQEPSRPEYAIVEHGSPSVEQQKHANTRTISIDHKIFPSSLYWSQDKNTKEAISSSSLPGDLDQRQLAKNSWSVSPNREKSCTEQEEKVTVLTEDEKVLLVQPRKEHSQSNLHGTELLSPSSEQKKDLPRFPPDMNFSKEQVVSPLNMQASSDQCQVSPTKQWHKSAFLQTHMQQGPDNNPFPASRLEISQGLSSRQGSLDLQSVPRHPDAYPCDTAQSHQGIGRTQSSAASVQERTGTYCSQPSLSPRCVDQSGFLREELKPPREFPFVERLAAVQSTDRSYPSPLVTHEVVMADKRLFMETLNSFHAALNLPLSVPKVEGNNVDLHRLYKEVTSLGGSDCVTKTRRWLDVAQAFGLQLNTKNALAILEGIYDSTLYHYERVYFLGARGNIIAPPAPALCSKVSGHSDQDDREFLHDVDSGSVVNNEETESTQALNVDPSSSVGTIVSGAIDGKFEDGYLVTVMVGERKLRGVLYHVTSTDTPYQSVALPSMMQMSQRQLADVTPKMCRKRKKREVFRKDPNAPRQNRTGYNFFFAEQRAKLKTMQPDKDRAISKMIGELWSKLSEDEKIPYQVKGVKDKERYVREMKEYKEKIKPPTIGSNEVHSQFPSRQVSSQTQHDPNFRSSMSPFSYMPEGSNKYKFSSSEVLVTDPRNTFQKAHMQLPMMVNSESAKAPEAAVVHLGSVRVSSFDDCQIRTNSLNCSSTVVSEPITGLNTNAATLASATKIPVSDTSVTPVVDMSKFLIDETSPKGLANSNSRQDEPDGLDHQ